MPFWGLKGPLLEVLLEVPKVDSEHPYITLKGFYMSQKINKKGGSNVKKNLVLGTPKWWPFDLMCGAFLEVLLEAI